MDITAEEVQRLENMDAENGGVGEGGNVVRVDDGGAGDAVVRGPGGIDGGGAGGAVVRGLGGINGGGAGDAVVRGPGGIDGGGAGGAVVRGLGGIDGGGAGDAVVLGLGGIDGGGAGSAVVMGGDDSTASALTLLTAACADLVHTFCANHGCVLQKASFN